MLLFIEVLLLKLVVESADTEVPQFIVELRDEVVFMLPVIALAMVFMDVVGLELEVVVDVGLETEETIELVAGIGELEETATVCVVADDDVVDPGAEDGVVGAMEVVDGANVLF